MFSVNKKVYNSEGREGKVLHIIDKKALVRWSNKWEPDWVPFDELNKQQ